jgi:hypothetical protein
METIGLNNISENVLKCPKCKAKATYDSLFVKFMYSKKCQHYLYALIFQKFLFSGANHVGKKNFRRLHLQSNKLNAMNARPSSQEMISQRKQ